MRCPILTAAALACAANLAGAQSATPTPDSSARPTASAPAPSTPGTNATASELVDVMQLGPHWREQLAQSVDAQVQINPSLAPFKDVFAQFFDKYAGWTSVRAEFVSIYATNFTEQELHDLIAFYKSPTGQKAISVVPTIQARAQAIGLKLVQQHQAELTDAIRQKLAQQAAQGGGAPAPVALSAAAPATAMARDHIGDPDPDPAPLAGRTIFTRPTSGMPEPVRTIATPANAQYRPAAPTPTDSSAAGTDASTGAPPSP
jgi:uncharacterized protein